MSIFDAVIQGAVQGLTEFLPISSSGHLSIIQYFMGQSGETGTLFSFILYIGTFLAIFIAFFKTIMELIIEFFITFLDIITGKFRVKYISSGQKMLFLLMLSTIPLLFAMFFKDFYKSVAMDNSITLEGVFLVFTGILLSISDHCPKGYKNESNMRSKDAFVIGIAGSLASLPGFSRSGSTIATGIIMGLDRKFAVAFSFIMGIPTVLGASFLELGTAVNEGLTTPVPVIIAGLLATIIFGLIAIKLVISLMDNGKFKIFSYYTLILGGIVTIIGLYEQFSGNALQSMIINLLK